VLLGFSYGGFVVTGALEHIAERVRHLVYLDAFVPHDGDTVSGLSGMDGVSGMGAERLTRRTNPSRPRSVVLKADNSGDVPRRPSSWTSTRILARVSVHDDGRHTGGRTTRHFAHHDRDRESFPSEWASPAGRPGASSTPSPWGLQAACAAMA